jgi:hypothetical protein
MSEVRGPLSAIASAVADPILRHQNLPPDKKILAQISLSSHALGWSLYLCPLLKTGPYLAAVLMGAALFGNGKAPDEWLPLAAWAGLTGISVVWLCAAWRQAQRFARREYATAFGRLVMAAAMVALLWYGVYPQSPDWLLAALVLKGFDSAWGLSHVCRFLIAAQLFGGGNALRVVTLQRQKNNRAMIAATARRGFRFLW